MLSGQHVEPEASISAGFNKALMPPLITDYAISPFIKTELLLLVRKGNKWFWLVIAGLWVAMLFTSINIAHLYLLPVLWFLQVTRWSELATKEEANRVHYFTYASYKPLQRMLPAQILAGIILALALALPLIIRYAIVSNDYAILNIISGAIFIVMLAVCLGIVSRGKKIFEIIFFLITYTITQKLPIADYLGAINHDGHIVYMATLFGLNIVLLVISFVVRNYQSRHL